jgi:plastocyanin
MDGSKDPEDADSKDWVAKKMAEILSFEQQKKLAEESPSEELKEINRVLDYEVMPVLEAAGVQITRDELSSMFAEWYVQRRLSQAPDTQASPEPPDNRGARLSPMLIEGKLGPILRPLFRISKVDTIGGLLRRIVKGALIGAMLIPIVFLPAYFFLSTLPVPPLAFNTAPTQAGGAGALTNVALTLNPTSPLIAPGQTQNYSLLSVSVTGGGVASPISLRTFSPDGLSLELAQTSVPSKETVVSIPVVISASSSLSPGPQTVTLEARIGSSTRNQTFTIQVVPAFVVMENLAFVPQILNVTSGTTVYWMNLDSTIGCCDPGYHNAVFGAETNISSPVLARLGTWSFKFETPGEFYYLCSIHPYMAGEVVVTG